jgi:hypothetical protein
MGNNGSHDPPTTPTFIQTGKLNEINEYITIYRRNLDISNENIKNTASNYDKAVILKVTYPSISLDYYIRQKDTAYSNLLQDKKLLNTYYKERDQLQDYINRNIANYIVTPTVSSKSIRQKIKIIQESDIIPNIEFFTNTNTNNNKINKYDNNSNIILYILIILIIIFIYLKYNKN